MIVFTLAFLFAFRAICSFPVTCRLCLICLFLNLQTDLEKRSRWWHQLLGELVSKCHMEPCFVFLPYLINKMSPSPFLISRWDLLLTCKNMIWPNQIFLNPCPRLCFGWKVLICFFFKCIFSVTTWPVTPPPPNQQTRGGGIDCVVNMSYNLLNGFVFVSCTESASSATLDLCNESENGCD